MNAPADAHPPIRLLQLEDSMEDAEIELAHLRRAGIAHVARRVETREAFIAALDSFKPDLILSDYKLPHFDGASALAIVRTTHPEIPVVMVSGVLGDEGAVELLKAGAQDFVLKDRMGRLGVAVANALRDGQQQHARDAATAALAASEQQLQALIENVSDVIIVAAPDTSIRFVSNAIRSMGGYEPMEIAGRSLTEFLHQDDLPRGLDRFRELMRNPGASARGEYRLRHADGTLREVELVTRNLILSPSIGGLVMVMRDITERRRQEAARRASEARYQTLFETTRDAIMTIERPSWHFMSGNPAAVKLFGAKDEAEFITLSPWQLSPEHQPDGQLSSEKAAAMIETALREGSCSFEWVHRRVDGEAFPAEVLLTGNGAGALYATVHDITDRKRAEAARQATLERARLQIDALTEVTESDTLINGDVEALARQITEVAARVTGVERANVWLFNEAETELHCTDLFEATPARHSSGLVLKESEFRNEFHALKTSRYVDADDPLSDPRTAGYVESYLKPLRITSMLDTVVEASGKHLGLLCLEHVDRAHHWEPDEIAFAGRLADKLGVCITNRRRREAMAALATHQQLLEGVLNTIPTRVFWKDRNLSYLGCNESFARDAGYRDPKEVIGKDDFAMGWHEQAELYRADDRKVIDSGTPKLFIEEPQATPDGHTITLLTSKVPLRDPNGTINGVLGTYMDITERKNAEQSLRRLNRALKTLSAGNVSLVRAANETELLEHMVRVLHEVGGHPMALIGYAVNDAAKSIAVKAAAGCDPSEMQPPMSWGDNEHGQSATARAIRCGEPQLVRDVATSSAQAPWRHALAPKHIRSGLSFPLRTAPGEQPFGALSIASSDADAFDADEYKLLEELAGDLAYGVVNLRTGVARQEASQKLGHALEGTIVAMGATMESRDPYTAGHQHRVAALAAAIGTEMGLDPDVIAGLRFGALVHDLGKIQLPTEILSKPGRLSKLEFDLIKIHPQAGYEIVKEIEFPWPIAQMVLQHHERLDGSGYPQGLKGEQIAFEAQILAVADVVEAMSAHRPYRPSLGMDRALDEIQAHKGTHYNAVAVDACLKLFREGRFKFDAPTPN